MLSFSRRLARAGSTSICGVICTVNPQGRLARSFSQTPRHSASAAATTWADQQTVDSFRRCVADTLYDIIVPAYRTKAGEGTTTMVVSYPSWLPPKLVECLKAWHQSRKLTLFIVFVALFLDNMLLTTVGGYFTCNLLQRKIGRISRNSVYVFEICSNRQLCHQN